MTDQREDLKIEVLVNSHGPHEQVRIREPFSGLQRLGIDCRMFRYPFLLNKTIRKNSLVIWQRPRPSSWEEQMYIIRFIRNRKSILLTEWDDHPELFPKEIRDALFNISMAPLKLCHGLHTSSDILANSLKSIQPRSYIFPNSIWRIPVLNIDKHLIAKESIRLFIGNQNRIWEHTKLANGLKNISINNKQIKFVIVGDSHLANLLPSDNVENHPRLQYLEYRRIMRSCHIALLPLENNLPNNCKTPIKWMEAASESVASIGGPGLYKEVFNNNKNGIYCNDIYEFKDKIIYLINNINARINIVKSAHKDVLRNSNLRDELPKRIKLYQTIWKNRQELDDLLLSRFPEI